MKKYLILLITILSISSYARTIELTAFGGYTLNGKFRTYYQKYPFDDATNFGGIVGLEVARGSFLELSYSRNDSKLHYTQNGLVGNYSVDMAVEHYQIGSSQQFDVHEIFKPFAGLSIGLSRFHPKGNFVIDEEGTSYNMGNAWAFTPILSGGLKIMLTDLIAFRFQGRFILPFHLNGAFSDVNLGSYGWIGIPLVSGDFTAGIIVRLGKTE